MNSKNKNTYEEIRIPLAVMEKEFLRILIKHGFSNSKADILADIFANNSLDGIYTHGVNRFKGFIKHGEKKYMDINGEPELYNANGAIEQWNGNLGPGPLNALFCTDRAIELAEKYGIGCTALSNTNHWMRPGAYGWKAAKSGFAFICWTNTIPIMPAWGSTESRMGNNPFVLAVPFGREAIVLDMAMSQYSYGIMESYKRENKKLPFEGGFNKDGKLTNDPAEILETLRPIPIGYWKGAGMALLLDILAAVLSGGLATNEISKHKAEFGLSQVFIAIDLSKLKNYPFIEKTINDIIKDYHGSEPVSENDKILYPGERVKNTREKNLKEGIPVGKKIWKDITGL